MIQVNVDSGLCMCAMRCVYLAPSVFEICDEGYAVVADPSALPEEAIIDAARQCPNSAITVRADDGKVVVGE
jgi:ferredoxin